MKAVGNQVLASLKEKLHIGFGMHWPYFHLSYLTIDVASTLGMEGTIQRWFCKGRFISWNETECPFIDGLSWLIFPFLLSTWTSRHFWIPHFWEMQKKYSLLCESISSHIAVYPASVFFSSSFPPNFYVPSSFFPLFSLCYNGCCLFLSLSCLSVSHLPMLLLPFRPLGLFSTLCSMDSNYLLTWKLQTFADQLLCTMNCIS